METMWACFKKKNKKTKKPKTLEYSKQGSTCLAGGEGFVLL